MVWLAWLLLAASAAAADRVADLRRGFENPPDDARIMMRWWWFGPAVTKPELEREMRLMKEGGIGGFEVQPVYPLQLEGNLRYLSDDFIDALRFTSDKARELGLRMDLTLGSGWPFGGPHIPITLAAGRLLSVTVNVPAGETSVRLRKLAEGEKFLAAFAGTDRLPDPVDGALQVKGPQKVQYFIAGRTRMMVKRAAVGAEGYVLDHYNRAAVDRHLHVVGDRLMQAFGPNPPHAIFSDSLELFASDWTDDLPREFLKRRGYDLIPYLPALTSDIGPKTAGIRCDWGQTLTELVDERYLTPMREWAHAHGTLFRSQTYGTPPVTMSSSALVDLPEGEHPNWRSFSQTRWASSASHLYGKPVTSSETWTWLHSPVFRATPLDMKAEADLHFLNGINQLVGHGWPYSPPEAGHPGWRFYAAAVFNNDNPWWIVMPDIAKYLQRISYLLRSGRPVVDVALYLPTNDARARFVAGRGVSIDRSMDALLGDQVIPQILDAGFNFDYIDDEAIAKVGIPYRILVLPGAERVPAATRRKIDEFSRRGGTVLGTRTPGAALRGRVSNDFTAWPPAPAIGFVHRALADGDLYFLVNTSNQPVRASLNFRVGRMKAAWWDPLTGKISAADIHAVELAPYESRVVVFSRDVAAPDASAAVPAELPVPFPSGQQAEYEARVQIPASFLKNHVWLDFGAGTPVPQTPLRNGTRAWLESPVREAAVVYVNGARAGSVWCPPYRVNIRPLLRPGENRIRLTVGNLAINALAAQKLPDYKDLIAKYGDRFQPQDMDQVKPLPWGLMGPVKLVAQ